MFDDNLDLGGPTEHSSIMGTNGQSAELRPRGSGGQSSRSIRRQTWNRDDVSLFQYNSTLKTYRHSAYHRAIPEYEF